MLTVYKRELRSYYVSMIGCAFTAFVIGIVSIYFSYYCLNNGYPYFGDVICNVANIMLLAIPIITMKSFAEEQKTKTDQMLYTSSISITKITIGKYLAMVTIWMIPMLLCCICPLIVHKLGKAYFSSDYAAIFAVFLLGCAYIAIGMFISSLTESTIIAGVSTFALLLVFQLMSGITSFISNTAFTSLVGLLVVLIIASGIYYLLSKNKYITYALLIVGCILLIIFYIFKESAFVNLLPGFLNKIPLTDSLYNFSIKIFDFTAIVYYLSIIGVFIFLTTQSIKKRRYS